MKKPAGGSPDAAETSSADLKGEALDIGREVIAIESEGLEELHRAIGPQFGEAVELILDCDGKVIVCGIGKSGLIARKIAATLSIPVGTSKARLSRARNQLRNALSGRASRYAGKEG